MAELGRGSHAAVYLARRPGIERLFALKLLPANIDPAGAERVKREAQLASRLEHPGIVRAVDLGTHQGHLYLVMDHIPGHTLQELLERRGRLDSEEAAELVARIADAVGAAHEAGVIHRDLKPANIVIDGRTGRPMVTDFGLARDLAEPSQLTQAGEMVGTPYYMAPEQVQGRRVDSRVDVYALGVMLYELLTGKRPFEGGSLAEVCRAILAGKPRRPREHVTDVDPAIEDVCLRALSFSPGMRPATASELARRLRGEGGVAGPAPGIAAGRGVPWALVAFLAAVGVGAGVLASVGASLRGTVGRLEGELESAGEEVSGLEASVAAAERRVTAGQDRLAALRRDWDGRAAERRERERALEEARARLDGALERSTAPDEPIAAAMRQMARASADLPGTAVVRARYLIHCGRARDAVELIDSARAAGDPDPDLLVYRAIAHRLANDEAAYEADLEELATLPDPDGPQALWARTIRERAGRHLERGLQAAPEKPYLYLLAAKSMKQMDRRALTQARQLATRGLRYDPTDVDLLYERSEAAYHLWVLTDPKPAELFDAFMGDLYRAREIRPSSTYWTLAAKSHVQRDEGRAAVAEGRRAVALADAERVRPYRAQARAWLANGLCLVGREEEAAGLWLEALDLVPSVARDVVPGLVRASDDVRRRVLADLAPSLRSQIEQALQRAR